MLDEDDMGFDLGAAGLADMMNRCFDLGPAGLLDEHEMTFDIGAAGLEGKI